MMKAIVALLLVSFVAVQAIPVEQSDEVGDQMYHQGRLATIFESDANNSEPIDEVGDNDFFQGPLGSVIGSPENNEPDEVGDFEFHQGPFANLIRSIQKILKSFTKTRSTETA